MLGAVAAVVVVLIAFAVLRGGGDSDDDPQPIAGPAKQVATVVTRLERATRRRQFEVLCNDLFTRDARARAGGPNCVKLLRESGKDVRRPRIRLLNVHIDGKRAQARVRTRAEGQSAVDETIDLQREGDSYRIAALGG